MSVYVHCIYVREMLNNKENQHRIRRYDRQNVFQSFTLY